MSPKAARLMELEGLRALAAIAVVIYHFLVLFFPALRRGDMSLAHSGFEQLIYGTPFELLYAGTLAVAIFFVMSGFVLSVGFFKRQDDDIIRRLASGRYLRLMIPSVVTVLLAYVFISFDTNALIRSAADLAGSEDLANKWSTEIGFLAAARSGLVDIFVREDAVQLNGVLWTMYFEFLGSFLVFGFLVLFARSRYRWIIYLVLIVATFNTWFLSFIIGVILADLYTHGHLERFRRGAVTVPVGLAAGFFGIFPKDPDGTLYSALEIDAFGINNRIFYLTVSATLFLVLTLLSERVANLLRHPRVSGLGKYTFSLYLMHLFVIYTVSSFVIVQANEWLGYNGAAVLSAVVSAPVIWIVTVLFEKHVDGPSVKIARMTGEIYRGNAQFDWRAVADCLPALQPLAHRSE